MRPYALTYPQLVRQATAAGWGNAELRRLRAAHDTAHRLFDGLYRAGGHPFICHTVRTASIVMAEEQAPDVVTAALVHAAYERHLYDGTNRHAPGRRLRAQLRRQVGADTEALVWQYHLLDRTDSGTRAEVYQRQLAGGGGDLVRPAVVLGLANELENHLDLARAHRDDAFEDRILSQGPGLVDLARDLGLPVMADELETAYAEHLSQPLPAAARWNRRRSYELAGHRVALLVPARRVAWRLRRAGARRLARWGRAPAPSGPPFAGPTAAERPRILVTGGAGQIAQAVVPLLREHFRLRLLDLRSCAPHADDEVVRADIRDLDAVRSACRDVDAVVHLAGGLSSAGTDELAAHNVDGTAQVFEAARLADVGTVVFASSALVVGGYGPEERVTTDMPVRPVGAYACTKVFGEALARHYAERFGMSMTCLRIGWFEPESGGRRTTRADLARTWCSPADLAQLIVRSIRADLSFAVFFAVSDNVGRNWDIDDARRLVGYEPRDGALDRPLGEGSIGTPR